MDTVNKIGFTINLLVDQLGTALFIPMVYVIVKHKKLHDSPCLKLIGIFMFACLCSKLQIIFPYIVNIIPISNVPLILCFAVQIGPLAIVANIMPIILSMAFDRCLSVFFPFWYCQKQKRLYFSALCALFVANGFYTQSGIFVNVFSHPMMKTNCLAGDLYGKISMGLPDFVSYMNYLTIFLYLLMVVKLVWGGRDDRKEYFKRQPIFISFAVTIFIQVIGTWLISAAYSYIPQMFNNLLDGQMTLVYSGINCLSSLLTTIQFWGIYLTSFEHRKALKKSFPRMFRFFPSKGAEHLFLPNTATQVEPILPINHNNNNINIHNINGPAAQPTAAVEFAKRERTHAN